MAGALPNGALLAVRDPHSQQKCTWMKKTPDSYLIVADRHALSCFTTDGAKSIGTAHRDTYVLLSDQDMTDSCEPPDKVTRFTTENPGKWLD